MDIKYTLPTDSDARKDIPIRSGCIDYFPAAIAGVAIHSKIGNDKHNPGQPLHHSRGKSGDHAECIERHLTDISDLQAIVRRSVPGYAPAEADVAHLIIAEARALAWRALALSQELHERYAGAPLAPAARLPCLGDDLQPTPRQKPVAFEVGSVKKAEVFPDERAYTPFSLPDFAGTAPISTKTIRR